MNYIAHKQPIAVGDEITVIERTYTGEVFEWDGVVTMVNEIFIETAHRRNPITHPQWNKYARAYEKTWTKHYNYIEPKGIVTDEVKNSGTGKPILYYGWV